MLAQLTKYRQCDRGDGGVAHEDIEATEFFPDRGKHRFDVHHPRGICGLAIYIAAALPDVGERYAEVGFFTSKDEQAGALRGQPGGNGFADARSSAGNQNALAGEGDIIAQDFLLGRALRRMAQSRRYRVPPFSSCCPFAGFLTGLSPASLISNIRTATEVPFLFARTTRGQA